MRILTAQDVCAAVDMRAAIDAVRAGFIALSTDRAHVPLRSVLTSLGVVIGVAAVPTTSRAVCRPCTPPC
jgi:ornithine cyclodeaminase/alanine dehydrogenase-like protein (mu-crystallin family)